MIRHRRVASVALFVALITSIGAAADYKDSFKRAIQALNQRRWAEAAQLFREALSQQGVEAPDPINISGMDYKPYLPEYYLGVALMNANDCAGALEAWRISEQQGAIKKTRENRTLAQLRRDCDARLAKAAPPPATPPPPSAAPAKPAPDAGALLAALDATKANLDGARRAEAALSPIRTDLDQLMPGVWESSDYGTSRASALGVLSSAQAKFDAASRESDLAQLLDAAALATAARQQFESVHQKATARRDELRRLATLSSAGSANTAIEPPSGGAPLVAARPAVGVAGTKVSQPPPSGAAVPPLPLRLPRELLSAAQYFFGGEYQRTLSSLAAARYRSGPAAAQAYLFRAAASHALYLLHGEKDAQFLRDAEENVRLCKKSNPQLRPDNNAFSPRFVQFFTNTR